jgi:hypothetical protein
MKRPAFLDEVDTAIGEAAAESYGDTAGSGCLTGMKDSRSS